MSAEITGGYALWVDWLDKFGRGVDVPMPTRKLEQGDGAETMHRLADRCHRSFSARLELWSRQFSRDVSKIFDRPAQHAEEEVKIALIDVCKRLRPLVAFVTTHHLTDVIRTPMYDALGTALRDLQDRMEDDARQLGPDGQRRLKALRELRLDSALRNATPEADDRATPSVSAPRRRMILIPREEV